MEEARVVSWTLRSTYPTASSMGVHDEEHGYSIINPITKILLLNFRPISPIVATGPICVSRRQE